MRHPLIPAVAAATLLFCLATAGSLPAASPQQRQAQARQNVERLSAELGESRGRLDRVTDEARRKATIEDRYSGLIAASDRRSAELGKRLARAERQLGAARQRLGRARDALSGRLVEIYMGGRAEVADLALSSGSFADLASVPVYLRALTDADSRLAARVADLRQRLAGRTDELTEARDRVERHRAALAEARSGIAAARAAAEASAARLASVNAEREGRIGQLKANINTWQKQIERRERRRQVDAADAAREAERTVERQLGGPYSIPAYIVMCESGGNYSALNASSGAGGAYQIMPSTWAAYGGSGLPHQAPKAEQDRIAAQIWADSGPAAWSCA